MAELVLAVIGAVTVVLIAAVALFVGITTILHRRAWGVWWWDEAAADGLESGRG